ncbi:MAG: DUF6456 domain-containing protein [Pseudomonadota bacterium]
MITVPDTLAACTSLAITTFAGASDTRANDVGYYLAHVEAGVPMRAIARADGRTPSTVLRAVRRVEILREDPLLDQVLTTMGSSFCSDASRLTAFPSPDDGETRMKPADPTKLTKSETIALARLAEPDSFLMVAKGAEKAGVFCRKNQFRRPLSLITLKTATRFLTNDWVKCASKSDLSAKYEMTAVGRAALKRAEADIAPKPEHAYAETPGLFSSQHQMAGERRIANPKTGEIETIRVNLGESPLGWLARRNDANGQPLLQPEEVEAGERLREDFEMAQIGPKIGQDWRRFLAPVDGRSGPGRTPSEGPMFARERVSAALEALGPGLSDAAIRICCFLEGLEATERRMGWSARSGKVVLKLALQRLVDHYRLKAKSGPDRSGSEQEAA